MEPLSNDSFDEVKMEPFDTSEPMFSTASGLPINVSEESIIKTKSLLEMAGTMRNSDNLASTSANRSKASQFISPMRNDLPRKQQSDTLSISRKRYSSGFSSPLLSSKNSRMSNNRDQSFIDADNKDMIFKNNVTGIVSLIEYMELKQEQRFVLLAEDDKKILIKTPSTSPFLQFGFKVEVQLPNNLRESGLYKYTVDKDMISIISTKNLNIDSHRFNMHPYIEEPQSIAELYRLPKESRSTAVIKAQIVDFAPKYYNGCSECHFKLSNRSKENIICEHCKKSTNVESCMYSLVRVIDYSGQLNIHLRNDCMKKFLKLIRCENAEMIDRWMNIQEEFSFLFNPIMLRLKKHSNCFDWEAVDVSEVDWFSYNHYLKEKLGLNS